MAKKIIKAQMKQRRDTFANWAAENPVLLDGELGIVSDDPNLYKVGDGSTAWNALPFRGFDGTLAQELGTSPNAVISQKVVSEKISELSEKIENLPKGEEFNKEGYYPSLRVGTSDDLAGRGESTPAEFTFRASGGKSIKDGRAYIKRIKGNSVVWNNMFDTRHLTGEWSYANDYMCLKNGHIYAFIRTKANAGIYCIPVINGQEKYDYAMQAGVYGIVFTSRYDTAPSNTVIYNEQDSGACALYDLTLMFGAGNEPTTIEEFNARKPIVADEYAYNEGEVIHMNTESIKSVGDNAWDEQWEQGGIGVNNGQNYSSDTSIRTKNFIRILPNTEYYKSCPTLSFYWHLYYDQDKNYIGYEGHPMNEIFTTPSNACYMKSYSEDGYGNTYKHDIMITLVHSGWKQDTDAGYQPYWEDTLPLPIIRKYFPQGMKLAGSAHDEIRFNKASGKGEAVQRIIGIRVADHVRREAEGIFILDNLPFKPINDLLGHYSKNVLMAGFTPDLGAYSYTVLPESRMAVVDDTIWLSGEQLKPYSTAQEYMDALGDTQLYYELAEPIVTEITEDFRDYYNVADFGTEQMLAELPSAPFSADIIYQFNAVDMIREHELEITELQKVIATMQAQLTSLINGGQ